MIVDPAPRPMIADDELREYLREWRRKTASQQEVPAFVVLHDTTLEELCRARPASIAELGAITGIGERKLATYGRALLEAIARFRAGARASTQPSSVSLPAAETLRLLREGRSLEEIARLRNRTVGTVAEMVAALLERGEAVLPPGFIAEQKRRVIEATCARVGLERLRPLKDALPDDITFDELRLVVADLRRMESAKSAAKH
jgi:ATP-dependent DNA helicase RecQ